MRISYGEQTGPWARSRAIAILDAPVSDDDRVGQLQDMSSAALPKRCAADLDDDTDEQSFEDEVSK